MSVQMERLRHRSEFLGAAAGASAPTAGFVVQRRDRGDAGPPRVAYVNFLAVNDALPEMPLFLKPEFYVPAPLEATYQTTWAVFPAALKGLLEP